MKLVIDRALWQPPFLLSGLGQRSIFGHYLHALGVPDDDMRRWSLPYHCARQAGIQDAFDGKGFFNPTFISRVIRLEDDSDEKGLIVLFRTLDIDLSFVSP